MAKQFPDILFRRAYQAHQGRHLLDAETLYRQLLAQVPGDIDACNLLGLLYLEIGRPGDAATWIGTAIELRPNDSQAHYNLGLALRELGRLELAAEHFRTAALLSPQNAEAHHALGNVLRSLGQAVQAIVSYRRALALNSTHAGARTGLSHVLNDLGVSRNQRGAVHEAVELFQEAVNLASGNADACINLGIVLEQIGQFDGAESSIHAAIAARPEFANAHFQLARLRNHESTPDEIRAMESLFQKDGASDEERAVLAYGLGMACAKFGELAREFDYLREAHALKSHHETFDLDRHAAYTDSLIEVFGADFLQRCGMQPREGGNLIFVVGMPRSGTSLTEQILSSHAQVFGVGEKAVIADVARRSAETARTTYPLCITQLDGATMRGLARGCAARLRQMGGARRIIVETTPTNFLHIGLIATLFPAAKIIHCARHPLDTCLSIYQHPLSDAHAYAHDFEGLAGYYRLYRKLMDHWFDVLPGQILELRYEHVVANFEAAVSGLLDHCGLPFDSACLSFHQTERVVRTPSASQVRQPIYPDSVHRWHRYAEQLAPLKALLASEIDAYEQP